MLRSAAGWSLLVFGSATFVASVVATYYTGAFTLDCGSIILFFLGMSVRDGSRRAAKWAAGIMVMYCLTIGLIAAMTLIKRFDGMKINGQPLPPGSEIPAAGGVVFLGLWCTVNASLLIALLWQPAPRVKESTDSGAAWLAEMSRTESR